MEPSHWLLLASNRGRVATPDMLSRMSTRKGPARAWKASAHRRSSRSLASVAGLAMAGLLAAGCSSADSMSEPTNSPSPTETATAPVGNAVTFETSLRSSTPSTYRSTTGPDDSVAYGLNYFTGSTQINDRTVSVRMYGVVDYVDNSGDFGGFLELRWSDGTKLVFRQDGKADYRENNGSTRFTAELDMIGGSGEAVDTTGSGTWEGRRSGQLGSPVTLTATVYLVDAPEFITGVEPPAEPGAPTESYSATVAPR